MKVWDKIEVLLGTIGELFGNRSPFSIVIYDEPSHSTSLNPVPNAQVCVYLIVHITKLQLQTTFPKPLYIPHSACIHGTLAVENLDVCTACDP